MNYSKTVLDILVSIRHSESLLVLASIIQGYTHMEKINIKTLINSMKMKVEK